MKPIVVFCLLAWPLAASAQPASTGCRDGNAWAKGVVNAKTPAALWQAEGKLAAGERVCDGAKSTETRAGTRVFSPVLLPAQPTGPGAGPWVMFGLSAGLLGGVAFADQQADVIRTDLAKAQAARNAEKYQDERQRFLQQQTIARGLAIGAGLTATVGLLWAVFGGEDDPVRQRPYFKGSAAGWEVSF